MARGRIVRELVSRDADSQDVLAWATGARAAHGETAQQEVAA
jgi:ribose transport system ATP-binding protein